MTAGFSASGHPRLDGGADPMRESFIFYLTPYPGATVVGSASTTWACRSAAYPAESLGGLNLVVSGGRPSLEHCVLVSLPRGLLTDAVSHIGQAIVPPRTFSWPNDLPFSSIRDWMPKPPSDFSSSVGGASLRNFPSAPRQECSNTFRCHSSPGNSSWAVEAGSRRFPGVPIE